MFLVVFAGVLCALIVFELLKLSIQLLVGLFVVAAWVVAAIVAGGARLLAPSTRLS
jgi:hypothetical protein